ncbi:cobalamin biosynthetic protein CobC [Rhizobium sp. BK529]|uniref:threonine-phosphate decarboxylase CobD n=1 Tax=unclassified Rhizobium TaxID=2613769 RepID=UPI00104DE166|nr:MULTISPECIES: threonine-phosphate decarboxylase CobD [unclassified Rhizobium]MBB3590396.1 cobalamin biosynthetic protein CobC [Rhizobium sp. BK529]TCS05088.1 L-threonine O-3-phosphate decarboxylase [Rhizobium sp. BK418]
MNAPIIHGGGITAAAATFGGRVEDWLDLSTGINPNPVSLPEIPTRVWQRLPDRHLVETARYAARDHYRSGAILPLPVPGTQSVIQLLPRLPQPGRRVAILSPTYGEYARAFGAAGFAVDTVSDIDDIGPEHGLAVVVNPNNPDGRVYTAGRLEALHERLKANGGFLVVDEAFGDTSPETSLAPRAAALSNLIILRSFGKFFGLAGLRLGFAIARSDILARFEDWLGPWAVSGPALFLAGSLLNSDVSAILRSIAERQAALHAVLVDAGLTVAGGTPLFTLVVDGRAPGIYTTLCRNHILVRRFDYAPDWLRFGLAPDAADDARLAAALRSFDR